MIINDDDPPVVSFKAIKTHFGRKESKLGEFLLFYSKRRLAFLALFCSVCFLAVPRPQIQDVSILRGRVFITRVTT